MADVSRLKRLLEIWYRNELYKSNDSDKQLQDAQRTFLMQAVNAEQASLGLNDAPPEVESSVRQLVEHIEPGIHSASEIDKVQVAAAAEVQKHLDAVLTTIPSQGLRSLRCAETKWGTANASATIQRHIHDGAVRHAPPLPNWYDAQNEGPYAEPSPTQTPPAGAGMYNFGFLVHPVGAPTSEPQWRKLWRRFVHDAERTKRQSTYFSSKWGVQELEDLRLATIDEYYEDAAQQPVPPVPDWTERARDKVAQWVGDDHPWYTSYVNAVRERLVADAAQQGQDVSLGALKKREVHEREGKANDLFVWRIVVVHLRALRSIGCSPDAPVTTCFEMEALVQTVAHLLKYRRCIRWAKSIYKTAGLGSLHDQYRSGLLNATYAHEHPDQSDTELGIARRMIRQAHVANHVHYQRATPNQSAGRVGADVQCMLDGKPGDVYRTDAYFTNPPMAPILCASPPRMGKTAMSLLVASFAAKLGGNVMHATWPHKNVAVAEVNAMIDALGWRTQNLGDSVRVYPHDEPGSVEDACKRVHQLANTVTSWVLHIRDQAHALTRERSNAQTRMHTENTYPLFYGMNMCVSATLLPALTFKQLVGSDDSIVDLLAACYGKGRVTRREREQCVVLQPWSFPIGPDCLVPPKTHFPLYGPMEPWYRKYYSDPAGREVGYYGTWLHTKLNEARLLSEKGVLIDDALVRATAENQRWVNTELGNYTDDSSGASPYKPTDAYATYLKHFNRHSTKYWNEQAQAWESGAPPRVVNAPIACLTNDAARILHQAEQWLNHGFLTHHPPNGGEPHKLHPMLLTAPIEQAQYKQKNGDMDWAVLLCKLAWLRMHKDFVNRRIRRDVSPNQLAERYGITVLVRSVSKETDRFVDVVSKREDMRDDVESAPVVAVTFDPRLAENRFKNYGFTHPDFSEGRLLPSALIPTLDAADIDAYRQAFHAASEAGEGLSAYNFLRNGYGNGEYPAIRTRLYRFDMRRCYSRVGCGPQDADISEAMLFGEETEEDEERAKMKEENARDEEDTYRDLPEAGEVPVWTPQDEYAPMLAGSVLDTDDQVTADCSSNDEATGTNDEAPGVTNLNGIALRLCMSGSPDVQMAVEATMKRCGIQRVAVVGFKMFEGGSTQATLRMDGAIHHFVPRFVSIAPNQTNGRDPSQLYQLVGRGFVDTKGLKLPSSWRLDLLATSGTRKLCRLYGNAELLLSQIRNESVEGRKLTLGTALGSITNQEYRPILDGPLEGDTPARSWRGNRAMREALATATGYHRPFHIVRDCLSGHDAPARKSDLLPEEIDPEALDILNDDMSIRAECLVDAPQQAAVAVEQRGPAGGGGRGEGRDKGRGQGRGDPPLAGGAAMANMSAGMARLLADD